MSRGDGGSGTARSTSRPRASRRRRLAFEEERTTAVLRTAEDLVVRSGVRPDLPFAGPENYLNYETSTLQFQWRVLREATEPGRSLLLDRVRFLAIVASNLDEFFQKRVGALKRALRSTVPAATAEGDPQPQLDLVREEATAILREMARIYQEELRPGLRGIGIVIKDYAELTEGERAWADEHYHAHLFPTLTPLAVDPSHPFPFISNLSLSLGVELTDAKGRWSFARVKVPTMRGRFVEIPSPDPSSAGRVFVAREEILAANAASLFPGMKVVSVLPFRVTRNAEIDDYLDDAEDVLELIAEEIRNRRYAPIVRLQTTQDPSPRVRALMLDELEIEEADLYSLPGFIGMADLGAFADLKGFDAYRSAPHVPKTHPVILRATHGEEEVDVFAVIRKGDLLVHHPYQSFDTSVAALVRQAARDPHVQAIKQTLYRTTEDSDGLEALIDAAESGKQVAVLVELKARFDEARNIELAQRLEQYGVHVTYGLPGLKTHCKVTLVVREEEGGIRRYFHIGTGNYNPRTARLYEDVGLLSCDPVLGDDLTRLFNYLTGYAPAQTYEKILVAPRSLRTRFLELVDYEIAAAERGEPARIVAKMNNLEDAQIIQRLYQASAAGVDVDLIVRSVCRLVPGRPGLSDRIRVQAVVGRFLEHSRIYHFHHGGEELYYIGSGDVMRRNLDHRVEVVAPIEAPELKRYLAFYLDLVRGDVQQSWDLGADGRYRPRWQGRSTGYSCHARLVEHVELRREPIGFAPRALADVVAS